MLNFHFCNLFKSKVKELNNEEYIYKKILENKNRMSLEGIGNINYFSRGLYILKISTPMTRVLIEERNIQIKEEEIKIFFVRDIILTKEFDRIYRTNLTKFQNGDWVRSNPLNEEDIELFIKEYNNSKEIKENKSPLLPSILQNWLKDFKLELNNEVFESEEWVNYALENCSKNGMLDKYVGTFRIVIEDILNNNIDAELIKSENDIDIYKYEKYNVGVLYSKINIEGKNLILLYNGAHLETQNDYWEDTINNLIKKDLGFTKSIDSISRKSFRSYPKWTINNDDLWFSIQNSAEISNLSLTSEQSVFFKEFKFPYYINGQAGSGKSTMLYYLFSNVYYYKSLGFIEGDVIFLTENAKLLEDTKKSVYELLTNNPEFDGLTIEQVNKSKNHFDSFKTFLFNFLEESDKNKFNEELYLNFSRFKTLYENSNLPKHIINKFSPEESWFTIITYIYGYCSEERILSSSYEEKIPRDSRVISKEKFEGIEKFVLPFYEKLINEDGYWDKLKIIRYIYDNINLDIKNKYSVIVCDEAQDFCKVELHFILRMSKYLSYDLSNTSQVPIVFAGDPNQTVNPTGFRQDEMTSMLYEELNLVNFKYDGNKNLYSPSLNYRSAHSVVALANFIQYYRVKNFNIKQILPQEARRPFTNLDKDFNVFLDYDDIKNSIELKNDLVKKLEYKIFIVPVDSDDKDEYANESYLLSQIKKVELKTSVESKGAEYKQVVLYGFGEYFLKEFGELGIQDKFMNDFRISYFFNKLYVGLTRAQTELIIIDSKKSKENFWKKLVDNVNITTTNWKILHELKTKTIEYNTDSIGSILTSTPENALDNAKQDKKQGIYHDNAARLRVAANQFFKLGYDKEANECLALSEEIKANYKIAAEYFIKAENYENASNSFFKGRFFNDVIRIGNNLKNIEQDLRIIISRVMNGESLIQNDIQTLKNNKANLYALVRSLSWRNDLMNQLITILKRILTIEEQKDYLDVLKHIAHSKDKEVFKEIANTYFELRDYKNAINAWETIDLYDDNEKFYIANIELCEEEKDLENLVLNLYELLKFKSNDEKKNILNKIINTYNENSSTILDNNYYLKVYEASLLLNNRSTIDNLGIIVEKTYNNDLEYLILFYETILEKSIMDKKTFIFVLERWSKKIWTINKNEENKKWLDILNEKYFELSKKYKLSCNNFTFIELENISDFPEKIQILPNEHFSDITIKNFRQFDNIVLSELGQFNLIVGDNNIGKTSLLESLLFTTERNLYFKNIAYAYISRNRTTRILIDGEEKYLVPKNFIQDFIKKDIDNKSYEIEVINNRRIWNYKIKIPTADEIRKHMNLERGIDENDFIGFISDERYYLEEIPLIIKKLNPEELEKTQLIPFGKGFDKDLVKAYHEFIDRNKIKRNEFLDLMKIFIPNIDRINTDTDKGIIYIEETTNEESSPIHQYGEGANKLFRILVQITIQKNKKLLIDEIDAGIHYSHFKDFWKVILQVAQENNVQIFATTHNIECIQYFKAVLEDSNMREYQDKSKIITLRRLLDDKVKAYTRDYEEFEYELDNQLEIRGGDID